MEQFIRLHPARQIRAGIATPVARAAIINPLGETT